MQARNSLLSIPFPSHSFLLQVSSPNNGSDRFAVQSLDNIAALAAVDDTHLFDVCGVLEQVKQLALHDHVLHFRASSSSGGRVDEGLMYDGQFKQGFTLDAGAAPGLKEQCRPAIAKDFRGGSM